MAKYRRRTSTRADAKAKCLVCHDGWGWWGKNAQAVAARHTDATGHPTYVESTLMIGYRADESAEAGDRQ